MEDLLYDGRTVTWKHFGIFNATSGMKKYQQPDMQCEKDKGPVPEGNYYVPLIEGEFAEDDGTGICQLKPSWQIQKIPRGDKAGSCDPYWANWGNNRVRFEPADLATKNACRPIRSGFYLHDSVKGFSHGCIELDGRFFTVLRNYLPSKTKERLTLKIKYVSGRTTNGGTLVK